MVVAVGYHRLCQNPAQFLLTGALVPGSAMKTSLSLLPATCAGNSCSSSGTPVSVTFPISQSKRCGDIQEFEEEVLRNVIAPNDSLRYFLRFVVLTIVAVY